MSSPDLALNQFDGPVARLPSLEMIEDVRQGPLRVRKRPRKEQSFICSWTECGRAFGKFEHLQRHERSRKTSQFVSYTGNN